MTETTPTAPTTVTVPAAGAAMSFATHDVATGAALTARQQFEARMANPTWANDALTPGTPAHADLQRLNHAMAIDNGYVDETGTASTARAAAAVTPPASFRFPYDGEASLDADAQKLDTNMRAWLGAAGFDADTGSNLAETVDQLARSREWTPDEVDAHIERGRAALRSVWGDKYDENHKLIVRLVDEVEVAKPGVIDFLADAEFLLGDPTVLQTLLGVAQRRYLGT